jgi:hypothetical protein
VQRGTASLHAHLKVVHDGHGLGGSKIFLEAHGNIVSETNPPVYQFNNCDLFHLRLHHQNKIFALTGMLNTVRSSPTTPRD